MCADSTYQSDPPVLEGNSVESESNSSPSRLESSLESRLESRLESSLESRLESRLESSLESRLDSEGVLTPLESSCKVYLDVPFTGSPKSPSINPADSLVFTLPDYYRTSPMNESSSSSVSDARSPTHESSEGYIFMPSINLNNLLKKVPSPKNGDPINTSDSMVNITRSRLEELEYIEKHMDEIVAYNLRKYIEEHESDSE